MEKLTKTKSVSMPKKTIEKLYNNTAKKNLMLWEYIDEVVKKNWKKVVWNFEKTPKQYQLSLSTIALIEVIAESKNIWFSEVIKQCLDMEKLK